VIQSEIQVQCGPSRADHIISESSLMHHHCSLETLVYQQAQHSLHAFKFELKVTQSQIKEHRFLLACH